MVSILASALDFSKSVIAGVIGGLLVAITLTSHKKIMKNWVLVILGFGSILVLALGFIILEVHFT